MKQLDRSSIFIIFALILILSFSINHLTHAANIDVACSEAALISAINTANANGEADTLNLATGCDYVLTAANDTDAGLGDSALKRIGSSITINGNGATIRRDSAAPEFRVLHIAASGSLILNDTTIRGGSVNTHSGGGILVEGSLTLRNSTVTANRAFRGGGIYNLGTLDGIGITVEDNTAGNSGGGVVSSGTLSLTDSTINDNASTLGGGGVIIENGTATMTGSTISGNSAVISGGILIFNGEIALLSSVVSGNSTEQVGAGGITNIDGILTLLNSVVSGNTFTSDLPIGIGGVSSTDGTVTIRNSIIWGNKTSASLVGQLHVSGTSTVSDSIIQDGFADGTNISTDDPLFVDPEPLSSAPTTGGNYHILPGSPALNAGNNAYVLPEMHFDIDGDNRILNTAVDIGADEVDVCLAYTFPYSVPAGSTAHFVQAIRCANENPDASVINLPAGSTYSFTAASDFDVTDGDSALPQITTSIVINANGAIIERSAAAASDFRLLHISGGGLILNNVTLHRGSLGSGAAIYADSAVLTLTGVTATDNSLSAAIYTNNSTIIVMNSTFSDNNDSGLAIYGGTGAVSSSLFDSNANNGLQTARATLTIISSTFTDNSNQGIITGGQITFGNVTVVNSTIVGSGVGIFNEVGSNFTLIGSVVTGNDTGVFNANTNTLTVINSTIAGNATHGIHHIGLAATVDNSIVWGNGTQINGAPTVSHSTVQGGFAGGTNILETDPLFVAPASGDYRLQDDSPALNAGSNAALPADMFDIDDDSNTAELLPIDLGGNPRIINATADMGAYEHQTLAAVLISKSSSNVTEGGATDTYSIRLASRPIADVTVDISTGGQTIVAPATLTFTPSDWSVEQTVTITAIDDTVAEGDHSDTLTHTVTSTDAAYDDFSTTSVSVTINDDDGFPAELLTNGDFEDDLDLNKIPDGWKYKSVPSSSWLNAATRDKLLCKPAKAHTGLCAFKFRGSTGENAKLVQVVNLTGITFTSGDKLTLSAYINGNNPAAKTKVILSVIYTDSPTPVTTKLTVKQNASYTLRIMPDYTLTAGAIDQIKVKFKHKSLAGKVFIDDASLTHTPIGGRRSNVPLPPPSAPSGFRGNN